MPEQPRPIPLAPLGMSPEEIAARTFNVVRRGFEPDAVRRFLEEVAGIIRQARAREMDLHTRLADAEQRAASPVLDEAALSAALGAETARVLQAAHEAAQDVVAKAEQRAEVLLEEASSVHATRAAAAEAEATQVVEDGRRSADDIVERTKAECRSMLEEARDARRRILDDLAGHRRELHAQIEQLRAAKDALAGIFADAAGAVAEVQARLSSSEDEAREAAGEVAHRLRLEHGDDTGNALDATPLGFEVAPAGPGADAAQEEDAEAPSSFADFGADLGPLGDTEDLDLDVELAAILPKSPVRLRDDPGGEDGDGAIPSAEATPVEEAAAEAPALAEDAADAPAEAPVVTEDAADAPAEDADALDVPDDAPDLVLDGFDAPAAEVTEVTEGTEDAADEGAVPGKDDAAEADVAAPGAVGAVPEPGSTTQVAAAANGTAAEVAAESEPGPEPAGPRATEAGAPEGDAAEVAVAGARPARDVDALFARIRASRAEEVTRARTVLAEQGQTVPGVDDDEGEPEPPKEDGARRAGDEDEHDEDEHDEGRGDVAEGVALAGQRDEVLEPIRVDVARAVKRVLRSQQNELLDAARTLTVGDAEELLAGDETAAQLTEAIEPAVAVAWRAGQGTTEAPSDDAGAAKAAAELARALADEVVGAIEGRITEGIASLEASGSGEDEGLGELVGTAYRDWKGARVDAVAGEVVLRAYAAGTLSGAAAIGGRVRWVLESAQPCADCDDNALSEPLEPGEAFPTGQPQPPLHAGCRCVLVAVPG